MLAHELRNPLAPIGNALAILRRRASADPTLSWVHDIIKRQVDQLTRLLNDLLEASRLTTGKVLLKKRPIEISETMRLAIESFRPLIRDRRQHLTVDFPPQPFVGTGSTGSCRSSAPLHNAANTARGCSIASRRARKEAVRCGGRSRLRDLGEGVRHLRRVPAGRPLADHAGWLGIAPVVRSLGCFTSAREAPV